MKGLVSLCTKLGKKVYYAKISWWFLGLSECFYMKILQEIKVMANMRSCFQIVFDIVFVKSQGDEILVENEINPFKKPQRGDMQSGTDY
jgi:hypothetical protein